MKPEEIVEMLKPYTQAQDGTNAALQGTGLGLFICVSLCHQMDGFLACSSTAGTGTVFHVGFPVGESTQEKKYSDDSEASGAEEIPFFSEEIPITGPILVCDDNGVNRKILNRSLHIQLKRFGLDIKILEANDGESCVEMYKNERPSVLFIDYHMPKVDGLEATKRIRKFEADNSLSRSYILSYTADVTEKASNLLRSNGTNEIMSKPPPKGFLASVVGRFCVEDASPTAFAEARAPITDTTDTKDSMIETTPLNGEDTVMEDQTAKKRSYQEIAGIAKPDPY
jgi:CheY-like chemotaxis protein